MRRRRFNSFGDWVRDFIRTDAQHWKFWLFLVAFVVLWIITMFKQHQQWVEDNRFVCLMADEEGRCVLDDSFMYYEARDRLGYEP